MKKLFLLFLTVGMLVGCDTVTTHDTVVNKVLPDSTSELTIPHTEGHEVSPDCIYDKDTLTDAFLKSVSEFSDYTWDESTKEARIILEGNDSLYIHVGGCQHYGVSATLTRVGSTEGFDDHTYWIEQALWIAERVEGFEPALLKDVDQKKNYDEETDNEGLFIDFHENDYSLIVDRKDGYTHITLNHYFH